MNKFILKTISLFLTLFSFFSLFFLSSCSFSNSRIYFGNFESYMSPDVMNIIEKDYNVDFQSFKTNEQLLREFDQNYDIAISSSYAVTELIKNNKLEKIDWSLFGLNGINNSNDALKLFIPQIQKILIGYDLDNDGKNENLLDYSIPYFFQDFIIGYKKDKLDFLLKDKTFNTWKIFFDYMKNHLSKYRTIAIDDFRTIFSFGKLVQNEENNVNPSIEEHSINDFENIFNFLKIYFGSGNNIIFNSDSGNVLNDLANPNGSELGIMYNGDVLYAMQGGDEFSIYDNNNNQIVNSNIGFIRPNSGSNIALDLIIFKKTNDVLKRDKIYEIIKKIALTQIKFDTDGNLIEDNLTYLNFDYVQYTSPLMDLYNYVTDINGYFSGLLNQKDFIDVFKINIPKNVNPLLRIEDSINSIQKSNMLISYLFKKSEL